MNWTKNLLLTASVFWMSPLFLGNLPAESGLDNPEDCCACVTGPTTVTQKDTSDGSTLAGPAEIAGSGCVQLAVDSEGMISLTFNVPNQCDSDEKPTVRLIGANEKEDKKGVDTGNNAVFNLDGRLWEFPIQVKVICDEDNVCESGCLESESCESCEGESCPTGGGPPSGGAGDSGDDLGPSEGGDFSGSFQIGESGNGDQNTSLSFRVDPTDDFELEDLQVSSSGGYSKTGSGPITYETDSSYVVASENTSAGTVTVEFYTDSPGSGGTNFRTLEFTNESADILSAVDSDLINSSSRHYEWRYFDTQEKWEYLSGSANGSDWLRKVVVERISKSGGQRVERRKVYELADGAGGEPSVLVEDREITYELFGSSDWKRIKERVDPDGEDLVSEWSYWLNGETTGPGSTAGAGRLKWYQRPDGYEENYSYGENWMSVSRTWKGETNGETVTTTWNSAGTQMTRERKVNGSNGVKTMEKTVTIHDQTNDKTTVRRYSDATTYEETVTWYKEPGTTFGGRTEKIEHPDGTVTTYDYATSSEQPPYAGSPETVKTVTVERGAGTTSVTAGERTVTKYNEQGEVFMRERTKFNGSESVVIAHEEVTAADIFGRPTTIEHFPGASGGAPYTESRSYSCCGVASETDRHGLTTGFDYDALGRKISKTRQGVTTRTVYDGLSVHTHRFSAPGMKSSSNEIRRVTRDLADVTRETYGPSPATGALVLMETEVTTYLNPLGGQNSLSFPNIGREVERTVIQVGDDGGNDQSQTTYYLKDGKRSMSLGSLEPEKGWARFAGSAYAPYTTMYRREGTAWNSTHTTHYDALGRVTSAGNAWYQTSYHYNSLGQLVREVSPAGVCTLYEYNDEGERVVTALSVDGYDTSIEYGIDQITSTETFPADRGGTPVIRTERRVWKPSDSTTFANGGGTVVSRTDRTPDGLETWSERLPDTVVATEHGGNGSATGYGLSHMVTGLTGNGDRTETTTHPDGTDTVETYDGGLLTATERKDTAGDVIEATYIDDGSGGSGYDSLNRVTHRRDLHTGVSETTYVSSISDRVSSVEDPAGIVTGYTYDHRGRKKSVVRDDGGADESTTSFAHYPDGRLQEKDGDLTYRVTYEYDYAGRMDRMTTYRSGSNPADTKWEYNDTTGTLTYKEDDAGERTNYTYNEDGRVKTRRWARENWTRYDYDAGGRLTAKLYFTDSTSQSTVDSASTGNDPLTPDAYFKHDRMNRMTQAVTAATNDSGLVHPGTNRVRAFHPDSLERSLEGTTVDPDIEDADTFGPTPQSFVRLVYQRHDSLARDTGYYVHSSVTGTPTSGYESKAVHTYDATGQIGSVTGRLDGADRTFSYSRSYYSSTSGYRSGSPTQTPKVKSGMIYRTDGPGSSFYAQRIYEESRNVLSSMVNIEASSWPSIYSYTVNRIGQRTEVESAGSAFSAAFPTVADRPQTRTYSYNAAGEVESSDVVNSNSVQVTAHLRGYQYDGIGNRERSIEGDTDPQSAGAKTYTPDDLNQYDQIDGSLTPVYDEDGNLTDGPLPADPSQLHDLEWDGENRLVRVSITGGSTTTYTYDAFGRRTVSRTGSTRTYTLWDGWNPLGEWTGPNHTSGTAPSLTEIHTWLWGLDISGTLDGAGGVGGLLADELHTGNSGLYYPLYDGNGNVTQYLTSSGGLAAHFEYDPFGNLTVAAHENGALTGIAGELPFKFSAKYEEPISGLYYYGYRFYEPGTGRWPSRDPIGERGGINLYGFIKNSPRNFIDILGGFCAGMFPPGPCDPGGGDYPDQPDADSEPSQNSLPDLSRANIEAQGGVQVEGCGIYGPGVGAKVCLRGKIEVTTETCCKDNGDRASLTTISGTLAGYGGVAAGALPGISVSPIGKTNLEGVSPCPEEIDNITVYINIIAEGGFAQGSCGWQLGEGWSCEGGFQITNGLSIGVEAGGTYSVLSVADEG